MPILRFPYGKSLTIVASAVAAIALASGASAMTIEAGTYQLFDHGDGNLGPDYGLRVDSLESELGISEVYFSFEQGGASIQLTWDGSTGAGSSATISGSVQRMLPNEGGAVPGEALWVLEYILTDIQVTAEGFIALAGSGTLDDPTDIIVPDPHVLIGESDGTSVFTFEADGHRLSGDSMTPVGRGWLLPPNSTDDFLFRATLVPEPSSGLLALVAMGFVAAGVRRTRG